MGLFGYAISECFVYCTPLQKAAQIPLLHGNIMISPAPLQLATIDDDKDENDEDNSEGTTQYSPPKHSESFLRHLESVKSSWPYNDGSGEDVADQTKDVSSNSEDGVYCTGEPSIDPSRMLQSVSDDDHDWM